MPFRQSKLTMVLRDSFLASDKVKIIMLACVCPGISSSDHTLNTLRYAERLKERPLGQSMVQSNYQSRQHEESGSHQRRANSSLPPESTQFLEAKALKPKQSPFGLKAAPVGKLRMDALCPREEEQK